MTDERDAAQRSGHSTTGRPTAASSVRHVVLLVDDSPDTQALTRLMLETIGYDVVCASSGIEALAKLRDHHVDAILMDCQMPGMDGFDTAREIRLRFPERRVPIIALTANQLEENRDKSRLAGMEDFLGKPVKADVLASALTRWIARDEA